MRSSRARQWLLGLTAFVFTAVAAASLVAPHEMAKGLGYSLTSVDALSEFRAIYVGLWLATALLLVIALRRVHDALLGDLCAVLVLGQTAGRILSLVLDGPPSGRVWPMFVIEALGGVALLAVRPSQGKNDGGSVESGLGATGGRHLVRVDGVPLEDEIQAIVDRETSAWDRQDAETLVSLFHPDMVWPWPPDARAHDPARWVFPQGRYDRGRWKAGWEELFATHELVHNRRRTVRIVVSREGDGAIAVVDVDTLWRNRGTGELSAWKGRACKGYTKVTDRWLLIFHTGLLDYGG